MKKPYPSIRVFENPYLEKLTHVHPIIPLVLWAPIVCILFYRSFAVLGLSVYALTSVAILGLGFWTLSEYLLHRFVFHFDAKTPFQQRLYFLIHGLHHDDPQDPTRLVMPPAGSLILAVLLFSIFRAIFGFFGAAPLTESFFAGFVIGYLLYDYIHYGVHHFNPKSKMGRMVKHHHMLHHFATPDARWGVSSPLWDYILGTVNQPRDSKHSKSSKRSQNSRMKNPAGSKEGTLEGHTV